MKPLARNNLIVSVIIILLAFFGFYLLTTGKTPMQINETIENFTATPTPTPYKQDTWTIMIGNKVFSPSSQDVPQNSKINFVNLSPVAVSIRFTQMPEGATTPSFNIEIGQSYTLTSLIPGKYTFIKVADPTQRGEFTVGGAF